MVDGVVGTGVQPGVDGGGGGDPVRADKGVTPQCSTPQSLGLTPQNTAITTKPAGGLTPQNDTRHDTCTVRRRVPLMCDVISW